MENDIVERLKSYVNDSDSDMVSMERDAIIEIEHLRKLLKAIRNDLHCGHAPMDIIAGIEEYFVNGCQ